MNEDRGKLIYETPKDSKLKILVAYSTYFLFWLLSFFIVYKV